MRAELRCLVGSSALRKGGDDTWTLSVHVQPGARRTEAAGLHGDRLKVRVAAPPVDGKANKVLIAWVAEAFGVPRGAVALVRGASSRQKTLRITGGGLDVDAPADRSSPDK